MSLDHFPLGFALVATCLAAGLGAGFVVGFGVGFGADFPIVLGGAMGAGAFAACGLVATFSVLGKGFFTAVAKGKGDGRSLYIRFH